MKIKFHMHPREATKTCPAGLTVSRKSKLPDGDFRITSYSWGRVKLWFVDADKFTADERQMAYWLHVEHLTKGPT